MRFCLACLVILVLGPAYAHDLRPVSLEVVQQSDNEFDTLLRWPVNARVPIHLTLNMPENCKFSQKANAWADDTYKNWRARYRCPDGIEGKHITIHGLDNTLTDALVRIELLDDRRIVQRLTAERTGFAVQQRESLGDVISSYFVLGVDHMLRGPDHLIFVLLMTLLIRPLKRLLIAVTAFTLAHSITLCAASLGMIHLPSGPIEVLIALSIVLLAADAARSYIKPDSVQINYPWLVIFGFGLLHGLGFAGALGEIGLPQEEIPMALLFFNVGVEAGQLLFIAALLLMTYILKKPLEKTPRWQLFPIYVSGVVGVFWCVQRVTGIFS